MAKKSFKMSEQPSKHFQNPYVSHLCVNITTSTAIVTVTKLTVIFTVQYLDICVVLE